MELSEGKVGGWKDVLHPFISYCKSDDDVDSVLHGGGALKASAFLCHQITRLNMSRYKRWRAHKNELHTYTMLIGVTSASQNSNNINTS